MNHILNLAFVVSFSVVALLAGCRKRTDPVVSIFDVLEKGGLGKILDKKYFGMDKLASNETDEFFLAVFKESKSSYIVTCIPIPETIEWVLDSGDAEDVELIGSETIAVSAITTDSNGERIPDYSSSSDMIIGYKIRRDSHSKTLRVRLPKVGNVEVEVVK
jgi:hypothetical protein